MSSGASRVPWWTIAAWTGLIGAVYLTRHLFFIFFMTFLFSYAIRRVTVGMMHRLAGDRERKWLERVVVLGCFLVLVLMVGILVHWLGPKIMVQARHLVGVVKTLDPQREMHRVLEQTVGQYLFRQEYGDAKDPRYKKALREFEPQGVEARVEFQGFPHLEANLDAGFSEVSGQEFPEYYAARRAQNPAGIPYDWEVFKRLRAAYPRGLAAFAAALGSATPGARLEEAFHAAKVRELSEEWWSKDSTAALLRETISKKSGALTGALASVFTAAVGYLLDIPLELGIALILSLFLLLDFRTVRRGVQRLKDSRLAPLYDAVAPGLVRLAGLVGKSFTAQAVISLVNAILSFIALEILGVDHAIALSSLVFVCSFIPVVGVILSGLPMVVIAIVQPGGSVGLALAVVAAILIIHFLETSILDPKIMGRAIHLHPVLVLVVLLFAEQFFGIWGLILGAPVTAYVLSALLDPDPAGGSESRSPGAYGLP